jgi:DNA repair exonuclease SbcCD ATPase subunit
MTSILDIRKTLEQQKGKAKQIASSISVLSAELKEKKKSLIQHEKAREIIKEVGLKTQQQLSFHISDVASLALGAVFPDPYELLVEFTDRRNKTECDLYFVRDDEKIDPLMASGGGAVDVASFALRIASWSMGRPRTNNVIILDEPMKNLSPEYRERGSQMLKEVSERLGIQFIIINHEPILTAYADRVFKVDIKNKVSSVETL